MGDRVTIEVVVYVYESGATEPHDRDIWDGIKVDGERELYRAMRVAGIFAREPRFGRTLPVADMSTSFSGIKPGSEIEPIQGWHMKWLHMKDWRVQDFISVCEELEGFMYELHKYTFGCSFGAELIAYEPHGRAREVHNYGDDVGLFAFETKSYLDC